MKEHECICTNCGRTLPAAQAAKVGGQLLCPDCLARETLVCAHCGERILRDDNAGNGSIPLCPHCYAQHYTRCIRCGELLHLDDAQYAPDDDGENEPMCWDCYIRYSSTHNIQEYYYKPAPIFYGSGPRYLGVELEIDEGGEDNQNAAALLSIANSGGEERAYCKHDGSLDEGFEIVTHPMSLDYHLHQFPWGDIVRRAVQLGYTSHQAGTCGLHVHVSRLAFGETGEQQEACIARILYFFERNWEELLKFSRRTRRQLDQWAARYGYKDQPAEILEHAKSGNLGRYACINLTNADTIEFRIFRGTLKLNSLLAALELVGRICDAAIHLTDQEIKDLSWSGFVAGCQQPELVQYLKERRLYVNEPVDTEEEV